MDVTVNGCFCFKLETGGIAISFFHMFLAIAAVGLSVFRIFVHVVGLHSVSSEFCVNNTRMLILFYSAITVVGLGLTYISYKAAKAIEARNHSQLKPMMGILCFLVCLLLLSMLTLPQHFLIAGPLALVLYIYMLAVIHSIRKRFEEERKIKYLTNI